MNFKQGKGGQMESETFRSLICDASGIIIGETVYRCLICSYISDSMDKIRSHYQTEHVDIEDISNGEFRYVNNDCPSPTTTDPSTTTTSGDSLNCNQQPQQQHLKTATTTTTSTTTTTTTTKANEPTNEPIGEQPDPDCNN